MLLDLLLSEPLNLTLLALVLAVIPLTFWVIVFYRKRPIDRGLAILVTLGGMLSVLPIWLYQWVYERYDHLDVFGAIKSMEMDTKLIYLLTFIAVGVIEEQFKHWVVSTVCKNKKEWRGVADAIEFSVLAALGFAFVENIVYFLSIMQFEGFAALIVPFIFRSAFSTFAHVFFSGVYGYHYGISKHAQEWMIEEMGPKHHHKFFITRGLYKLFKIRFFNIAVRLSLVGAFGWMAWLMVVNLHLPILQNQREDMWFKVVASVVMAAIIIKIGMMVWHAWRHLRKIHMGDVLQEEETMEGLFLAMVLHAIYNFILWLGWTWMVPPYLLAGYFYLAHEFKVKENLMDFEGVDEKLRRVQVAHATQK